MIAQGDSALMVSLALMRFWDNPTLPAAAAGALALVTVSGLTPATRSSFEEVAEDLKRERQHIEGGLVREPELTSVVVQQGVAGE